MILFPLLLTSALKISRSKLSLVAKMSSQLTCSQKDSYIQEGTSKSLGCMALSNGRYEVILNDSVLYPEGGGQPCDLGFINDLEVFKVDSCTEGIKVILAGSVDVDAEVTCKVDWGRRYDFMQQHSCQHLVSGVANKLYQLETVKWELGSDYVAVDFIPNSSFTSDNLLELEEAINAEIRNRRSITWSLVSKSNIDIVPNIRGAPKGAALNFDDLRVITIDGLDSNPCGGTHVNNTSELQMCKLISYEMNKGNTSICFVCGNRIMKYVTAAVLRENKLTRLLSVPAVDHVATVDVMLKEKRETSKLIKNMSEEYAVLYGSVLYQTSKAQLQPQPLLPHTGSVSVDALKSDDTSFTPPSHPALLHPSLIIVDHKSNVNLQFLQNAADAILSSHTASHGRDTYNSNVEEGTVIVLLFSTEVEDVVPAKGKKESKKQKGSEANAKQITDDASATLVPLYGNTGPFILYGNKPKVLETMKNSIYEAMGGRGGGRPGKLQGVASALCDTNLVELSRLIQTALGY